MPLFGLCGKRSPQNCSNVAGDGDARDGKGFISRITAHGRLLEQQWAKGLNAPKGMARVGETLYVSDIDCLVTIDAASGSVMARYPIECTRRVASNPKLGARAG